MTTPPTPAGWYPDPEHSGGLRYWDGVTWTEHRTPRKRRPRMRPPTPAPACAPAEPAELPGTEPWAPIALRSRRARHRAADGARRAARAGTRADARAAPVPLTEQPTTKVPLREPAPYADATTPTPAEPPEVEPPAGTEPPAPVDNRKLIVGFGGAVAALLLVLVLVAVYAFVIHKDDTRQHQLALVHEILGHHDRRGDDDVGGGHRDRGGRRLLPARPTARWSSPSPAWRAAPPSPIRPTTSSPRTRRASSSSST